MTTFETPLIENKRIGTAVILGAGPTGLSTAWRLGQHGWKVIVIEKEKELGGHGRTSTINGYNVDDGPHKLYPQVPCAKPFIEHFVGDDLLTTSKKSTIYLCGQYIPYPFGLGDLFKGLGIKTGVLCGLSYILSKAKQIIKGNVKTYTDFAVAQYGSYAHKLVFRHIAEKLWGDPNFLHVQLAKTRIIAPNIIELVLGLLLGTRNKPKLSADEFYYPKHGLRQLWEAVAREIEMNGGTILRNARPSIITENKNGYIIEYTNSNGNNEIHCDVTISTIPLKTTLEIMRPLPPKDVIEAAKQLKLSSLLILYVVVKTPRLLPVNWIFFPELNYHFGRLSEQKGFSEAMVPADRTVLMVEIPLARVVIREMDRGKLISETIAQLREVGIIKPEHSIIEVFTSNDASIYPIYDLDYLDRLQTLLSWSDNKPNFYLNGRLGLFCYNNMDHSMEMGLTLADYIARGETLEKWQKIREKFYEYKIVD